jgi:hypothetical protein
LLNEMPSIIKADKLRSFSGKTDSIDRRLARMSEDAQLALRQFDVGMLEPDEPELPPTMANTVQIGVMAAAE